jgi:DNA segregation ATPase FtsK/SpoIIIE, S-DNA-T family
VAYLADDVKSLKAEMSRRYKVLESLSEAECPEGKVSTELANRKALGLHPVVLAMDECQFAFEHPTLGKGIEADVTDLVKRGPAVGICVILATQRPDAKSIPPGIGSNAVLRFCLKVLGQVENDMVLGTSMYKAGVRATMFARSDLGVGILAGEGDAPRITRGDYIDGTAAKQIAARARALRLAAGTLSGYAADLDHTPDKPEDGPTLLDDLAAVLPAGEGKVRSEDLIARLVEHRPGLYDQWTPADLGNAVKPLGLDTVQIARREDGPDGKPRTVNRRGLDSTHVHTALTQRDRERDAGTDSET